MLVLSRKSGQSIVIGDGVTVTVNRVSGNRVTIGIQAPGDTRIVRGELLEIVDSFSETQDTNESSTNGCRRQRQARRPSLARRTAGSPHFAK